MRDYSKTWVEWVEPFSEATGSDPVYIKIRGTTAVTLMKSMHSYTNDEDALMDFVVVNWAIVTEEKA
jgi:hypothetical protein